MVDDILNFSISGIYSLLILSLTFNFLLTMRLRQLEDRFVSYTDSLNKKTGMLAERLDMIASRSGKH